MTQPLTRGQVSLAVGGMRLRSDIVGVGWTIRPSIGIVARDIDRLGLAIQNFREPLTRSVRKVIIPSIRENFDSGGRPAWRPLADYTQTLRGEVGPILVRSGRLRQVATRFGLWEIKDTSATIRRLSPEAWYGALHQGGYDGIKANIPQRRFLLFQEQDEDDIMQIFFDWMSKKAREEGKFV